jgi:hypothetical protein
MNLCKRCHNRKDCPLCGRDLKVKANKMGICHLTLRAHFIICPDLIDREPPF